jgi:thioredoxin reductase (NADPH)
MSELAVDIAVVGAGGAGVMAHLRAVLNGDRCAILTGDAETRRRSRATWVALVDNIPGFHGVKRPISQVATDTLAWLAKHPQLAANQLQLPVAARTLNREGEQFSIVHDEGVLHARYVILTTGVMDVQPMIGGKMEPIFPFANRGDIIYCVRCDGHHTIGKRLSVIGATDGAIRVAATMIERYQHATVAVLTAGVPLQISDEGFELAAAYGMTIHDQPLVAIHGDARREGLTGYTLADGTEIESNSTIVALGIKAYNSLLLQLGGAVDEDGLAIVGPTYESSVRGLFIAGDLVSDRKMQIYTAWDEAVDAADEINRRLRLSKRQARLAAFRAG